MEQTVYLLGMKQSAWMTGTGQYSTDINDAKIYGLNEALTIASRHKSASNILVPVRVDWMNAI